MNAQMTWSDFTKGLAGISFPQDIDLVIGIGRGGIIPAALIARRIEKDLRILWAGFRGPDHKPLYASPRIQDTHIDAAGRTVLIVDDVSRTGATLTAAKAYLKPQKAYTFVVNGLADFSLINTAECVRFPWG